MTKRSEEERTWQPIEQTLGMTPEQQQQLREAVLRTLAVVGPQNLREYMAAQTEPKENTPTKA